MQIRAIGLDYYPADKKFQYLLEILPPSALSTLPYSYITNAIKGLLKKKLNEEEQRFLVRLVLAVRPAQANIFLDFLLEKEDGEKTNFQVIYDSLTDARLERYPFINWFVNEQTNRKYFAFAIYQLWRVSKYDLQYVSPGSIPIESSGTFAGVDPNNYFSINRLTEYNINNYLIFSYFKSDFTTKEISFDTSIDDKKIKIRKIETEDSTLEHIHNRVPSFFGYFHLYHPISYSNLVGNSDLMIPEKATLPAFLFHFILEYDELADFDAGVALAISLTADVLLAYFLGGVSVLRDLQYLKYTTKIGRALQGGLSGTEAVEVWRGLEVGSEIFTLTASELVHVNQYLITEENNLEKKKILEKSQKVILTLMMLGVASSIASRVRAVQEANETLILIDLLPPNTPHNIPQPMIDLLTTLSGQQAVTLTLFGNRLNNLELGNVTNSIASKFNIQFTEAQRLAFWRDFQHIVDPEFWKLLNSGKGANGAFNGSYIDNWISLSERGLQEAKFTDYICVQRRTDALINYIDEPITKPIINNLSHEKKLAFINNNGDASSFAVYTENPNLIKVWEKYSFVSKGNDLSILSAEQKFKFLKSYENSTQAVVDKIKNGGLIKYFKIVDEHPLNLLYQENFIKRVEYLEAVKVAHTSSIDGELLIEHLRESLAKYPHDGQDLIVGFKGWHLDNRITEIAEIDTNLPSNQTIINRKTHITGPIPTVNAPIQSAIKKGTVVDGTGIKQYEVLIWGYARQKSNGQFTFILDANGNPLKAWVPKMNNGGKTSIFVGLTEEQVLNEIAFARLNLTPFDWVRPRGAGVSNEWQGISSRNLNIGMYMGPETNIQPSIVPNSSLHYESAFPKFN